MAGRPNFHRSSERLRERPSAIASLAVSIASLGDTDSPISPPTGHSDAIFASIFGRPGGRGGAGVHNGRATSRRASWRRGWPRFPCLLAQDFDAISAAFQREFEIVVSLGTPLTNAPPPRDFRGISRDFGKLGGQIIGEAKTSRNSPWGLHTNFDDGFLVAWGILELMFPFSPYHLFLSLPALFAPFLRFLVNIFSSHTDCIGSGPLNSFTLSHAGARKHVLPESAPTDAPQKPRPRAGASCRYATRPAQGRTRMAREAPYPAPPRSAW